MNRSDSPKKQPVPFGVNGQREDILSTTPAGDNTASYDSGFPPVTMILKAAGGLPPKGQDMNQILYELSNLCRWFTAGAMNSFDASFAAAISGYPKGAVVLGDDGVKIYISTIDANLNNPNSVSTGWLDLFSRYAPIDSPSLTGTPTAPTASFGTNTTQIATMAALQTSKGALSGVYSVSSANTLTATAAGALVYMTGGVTFTTTLPAGTTVALGQTIRLANYSTAAQTIAAAGTDIIYGGAVAGSVSSVSMQAGASLALISRGNGEWDITGGTNAVQYASGLGLVSPSLTGAPTAPTATAGTSTTQLATTAFVSNALTTVTGRLLAVKTFTASSVYTKTAGTQSIIVEVLGGGAPGGSAVTAGNYQACSGGGAGAFIRGRMTTVPASVSVTVGAGSAPGTSTGGVSAFGSYLTSGGGAAGSVAATTDPNTGCCVGGGAGGDATYDSANVQLIMMCRGGAGSLGIVSGVNGAAGNGGDSFFGGGGRGPATSSNIVGNDGYLGAGGSGAVKRVANTDTEAGGIGGNGLVVIYEYA